MSLEIYRKPYKNSNYEVVKYLNLINNKLNLLQEQLNDIKDALKADITNTY